MDISNFMTWFLSQVINIFTYTFNTLNSITFMGTSLLKVILTITILGALLPVLLTISQTQGVNAERRAYKKARNEARARRREERKKSK